MSNSLFTFNQEFKEADIKQVDLEKIFADRIAQKENMKAARAACEEFADSLYAKVKEGFVTIAKTSNVTDGTAEVVLMPVEKNNSITLATHIPSIPDIEFFKMEGFQGDYFRINTKQSSINLKVSDFMPNKAEQTKNKVIVTVTNQVSDMLIDAARAAADYAWGNK